MTNLHKDTEKGKNENFERFPDGRNKFKKGHKIGRIKKRGYILFDLTKVIMQYDKTHDITVLQHFVSEAIKDNKLLKELINKYVPTRNINEFTGEGGGPLIVNVIRKMYSPQEDKQ